LSACKEGRKQFFFEKKNQKTFARYGRPAELPVSRHGRRKSKSFLVLFFKKELLPSYAGKITPSSA
jgi:hypothetical protein